MYPLHVVGPNDQIKSTCLLGQKISQIRIRPRLMQIKQMSHQLPIYLQQISEYLDNILHSGILLLDSRAKKYC